MAHRATEAPEQLTPVPGWLRGRERERRHPPRSRPPPGTVSMEFLRQRPVSRDRAQAHSHIRMRAFARARKEENEGQTEIVAASVLL